MATFLLFHIGRDGKHSSLERITENKKHVLLPPPTYESPERDGQRITTDTEFVGRGQRERRGGLGTNRQASLPHFCEDPSRVSTTSLLKGNFSEEPGAAVGTHASRQAVSSITFHSSRFSRERQVLDVGRPHAAN